MTAAVRTRPDIYVTEASDGGLLNVSTTELAAQQWGRPQDAVVRYADPGKLEVAAEEMDAMEAVLREPMPAGRRTALRSLLDRMVVPLELHVAVKS